MLVLATFILVFGVLKTLFVFLAVYLPQKDRDLRRALRTHLRRLRREPLEALVRPILAAVHRSLYHTLFRPAPRMLFVIWFASASIPLLALYAVTVTHQGDALDGFGSFGWGWLAAGFALVGLCGTLLMYVASFLCLPAVILAARVDSRSRLLVSLALALITILGVALLIFWIASTAYASNLEWLRRNVRGLPSMYLRATFSETVLHLDGLWMVIAAPVLIACAPALSVLLSVGAVVGLRSLPSCSQPALRRVGHALLRNRRRAVLSTLGTAIGSVGGLLAAIVSFLKHL